MAEQNKQQVPSIGRVVHFVLPEGPHKGEHRPAIIVRVWSDEMVNLQVFTDGQNDDADDVEWVTSAHQDTSGQELRTWHWPEYVPAKE
jgi:hypothetical protein